MFSRRALPLAAWTNGLEIAAVKADVAVSERGVVLGVEWAVVRCQHVLK